MAKRLRRSERVVSLHVHPLFFDRIFESERRNLQSKLGVQLSQREFTEYLAKSNAKISYPKMNNIFAPKKNRRSGLSIL